VSKTSPSSNSSRTFLLGGFAMVRIVKGKGSRSRAVPMVEELMSAVRECLEFRPDREHDALFTSQLGNPLCPTGLQQVQVPCYLVPK